MRCKVLEDCHCSLEVVEKLSTSHIEPRILKLNQMVVVLILVLKVTSGREKAPFRQREKRSKR